MDEMFAGVDLHVVPEIELFECVVCEEDSDPHFKGTIDAGTDDALYPVCRSCYQKHKAKR